ncbi:CotH kinase family protein [Catalinimonas niigatensis]|uniref:CotH kinase family protein n=1 Tax=Catalinimonas niigatensis TaxID=1397264 RepID=UPI0026650947|nr:CotH kinase family protein [Catalinimonas niigatensis]WPP52369.1 CotH kinase family protein [Catalinimonas niigatensis]
MLIKRKNSYRTYIYFSFAIFFFFLGFYLWLDKAKNKFTITYDVQADDSIINVIVKDAAFIGQKPVYTFVNESSLEKMIKVEGAHYQPLQSSAHLPNYPAPQQDSVSFPEVAVLAISPTVKPEYYWNEAQFKTFLKDSLPLQVVSLVGPKSIFFGEEGLYSVKDNYSEKANPEHILHFELLSSKGDLIVSSNANAHVAGKSTKKLPLKSLDLHFEGSPLNSQDIFNDGVPKKMYSLRLRSAGNDFLLAYMRDVVVSELAKSTHMVPLNYKPVVVFINGEYWGIQYLREHISAQNILAMHPHLTREQVVLGELHENRSISNTNGFDYKMEKLMDFIETEELNLPENYERLTQLLNLDNFIDYIVVQTFISNTDWPHNNVKGVFLADQLHFLLYDTDFAFNFPLFYKRHTDDIFNMPDWYYGFDALSQNYFDSLDHHLPSHVGRIYTVLTRYRFFREHFINRYHELLEDEFSQSRIEKTVADIRTQIKPLMPSHIARWGYPKSMESWILHTQQIISFSAERRKYVLEQLNQHEQLFAKANQGEGSSREESP